ncbi:MAG: DUF2589 domain-containing protein [Bacteroidales bacterium]|jgi:hypothetical protein|nr:DUF2589 domain-containing protein [Bacteroidales bacterium]
MSNQKEKKNQLNSQVMTLHQLISAPLVATLEADAMTTRSYIDFLRDIAFEPAEGKDKSGLGKLRTFTFQYMQADGKGKSLKSVQIPVISLIPIPLLQIKEAVFDFEIKILDAISETKEENYSFEQHFKKEQKLNDRILMRAALAPQSGNNKNQKDNSLTANMKVKVVMQQADMPSGLANLLSLSANNMLIEDSGESPSPNPNHFEEIQNLV